MGEEKRFVLFLVLTMLVVVLTKPAFDLIFGPAPRPAAKAPDDPDEQPDAAVKEDADKPEAPVPAKAKVVEAPVVDQGGKGPAVPAVPEQDPEKESRTLGSTGSNSGYKMKVQFSNRGAAVERIELTDFQNEERTGPLQLMATSDDEAGSFLLDFKGVSNQLDKRNWRILDEPPGAEESDDSSIRFQATLVDKGLVITKTYRLKKASYNLGLELEIANRGDDAQSVTYRLGGPRGFVLEGAWYATKKREAAIADGSGSNLKRHAVVAADLVKGTDAILELADASGAIRRDAWKLPPAWFDRFDWDNNGRLSGDEVHAAAFRLAGGERNRWVERPVRFAGVDSQFFCVLLIVPAPKSPEDRWDAVTTPVLVTRAMDRYKDRSDVSVEIESRAFDVASGESLLHSYSVYAGPRNRKVLEEALVDPAIVHSIMNFQGALFIFPSWLVGLTASTMIFLLQTFHGWVGNWGVAILMLTVMVRMLMFPLSRKQALSAVKMQSLKPELDALKEKYKSDKEKLSRAQMELWRKHGVNPLGGCLPLVIQMPIFIGLWQGLQSSVELRQAKFLWIDNLAAPDGPSIPFFEWGENVPLVSWLLGPYFNLLPCILIALMLVQQKMFMPPKSDPPDPQMEMQQKMMTYMMVMFGAFFWKLPSGLCLYYICSTTWGIVERKLLPKLQHADATSSPDQEKIGESGDRKVRGADRDGKSAGRDGKDKRPQARQQPTLADRFTEFLKNAGKR
jgi:YidC/Oxa1 family membrane protein insertase